MKEHKELLIYLLSMIKDEQRYLDEWLEYNLKLGFDKIILFEDYNSKPHDISKYDSSKVILYNILDIYNDEELKQLNNHVFRQSITWNCFNRLYGDECDFVCYIDVDEFLNINKEVHEFIQQYKQYAQIEIPWRIHTYTGHIQDPYPGQKYSVQDTYFDVNENCYIMHVKSFYNLRHHKMLHTYNGAHNMPHRILDSGDSDVITLTDFRIEHYLAKSLDEYIWKLSEQGLMCHANWERTINDFFKINNLNKEDYIEYIKSCTTKYNIYNPPN